MKLLNQSYRIVKQAITRNPIIGINKHIEKCARTCYKSEESVNDELTSAFVQRLIDSGHTAMLEHATVYLDIPLYNQAVIISYAENQYSRTKVEGDTCHVTTNYRVLVDNEWLSDLSYACMPSENHFKRYTVKFICNRQVSHEFVRHRNFSFAQESTRFCNYSKGRFDGQLSFIAPCWLNLPVDNNDRNGEVFIRHLQNVEGTYLELVKNGWSPQEAASVLPNATKTELVMTGFSDDWKEFFEKRSLGKTGKPHPQAYELASALHKEFVSLNYIK